MNLAHVLPTGDATAAARSLRSRFDGHLFLPGDDGYEAAHLGWNRTIDAHPAIIAVASSPCDVQAAVMAAHDHGLPLAVQATGHGTVVSADGALLLVTSELCSVEIDPAHRCARVGPGAVWAQVNAAAAQFGLGSLAGRCATVGVTGYTLGGGAGWLSRTFGFAADSALRAEVVTADGRIVTASCRRTPRPLLGPAGRRWQLRDRHLARVQALPRRPGVLRHVAVPARPRPETLAAYGSWAVDEPVRMNSAVLLMRLPPHPSFPEPLRGRRVLAIRAFHLGGADEGRRVLAPLLEAAGPPLLDRFAMRRFPEASAATNGPDAPPMANRQYLDLCYSVRKDAVDAMVEAGSADSPLGFVELRHWGGAMADPRSRLGTGGSS